MFCKFCGKTIGDDLSVCPECGKDLSQPVGSSQTSLNETTEKIPAENVQEDTAQNSRESEKKIWPMVLGIAGTVVLLGILAIFLLKQFGVDANPIHYVTGNSESTGITDTTYTTGETNEPGAEVPDETGEATVPPETVDPNFVASNYCVDDTLAVSKGDVVVATIGEAELTNSVLQIYYFNQISGFFREYGNYLSYLGLNPSVPLATQPCYHDKTISWETYFVNAAVESWQQEQVLVQMAKRDGFTLSAEVEEEIAQFPEVLEQQAKDGEYENAEAMIKDILGPANTLEGYMAFMRDNLMASEYYNHIYKGVDPTDEDVEVFFAENEAMFTERGITKDAGLNSSVRHILIGPEVDEGAAEATDAQWAACLEQAEKILQEWKDGDATEESFAALVPKYTEDTGSATTGGLYENIYPGASYVEDFLSWSVSMERKPGDTDIVKSQFGYHIMYFVSGEPYWYLCARSQYISDTMSQTMKQGLEEFPIERLDDNIALREIKIS